jgi:hypothetical protein
MLSVEETNLERIACRRKWHDGHGVPNEEFAFGITFNNT